jgi:DMSO/TMAO reductase YedYZ molybdopterin-dependent catalytic subunit
MTHMLGRAIRRLRADAPATVTALVAGVVGVAGSYAAAGSTPSFVGAGATSLLVNTSPGPLMTVAIGTLGDYAKYLAAATAVALLVLGLAAVARLALAVGARVSVPYAGALVALAAGWLLAATLTDAVALSFWTGLPMGVAVAVGDRRLRLGGHTPTSLSRRGALKAVGGATAASVGAYLLGRGRADDSGGGGAELTSIAEVADEATAEEAEKRIEEAAALDLDVAGLDGLVTRTDRFYEVDINVTNPNPSADRWSLSVQGAVDRELTLTYGGLFETGLEHRFNTLRCVSDPLNGTKMDTALWTGVPMMDVLERAGVPDTCCVMLHASDGYYQEFPLSALREGFLAVGMNGHVLPRGHGYPARALIPGHWGEIQVKWLTEIEVLREEKEGYWEKRGWHGTGPVNTVAKLRVTNRLDDGRVELAGHAYAGTRGVDRVEVSTDGGETWTDAALSERLPGVDTWRQWVHRYDPSAGSHEVVVRATDGTGTLQPREYHEPFPRGATGWVSREIGR